MKILVINAGSSSVKFTLYETEGEQLLAEGLIERINTPQTSLRYSNHKGQKLENTISANSYERPSRRPASRSSTRPSA